MPTTTLGRELVRTVLPDKYKYAADTEWTSKEAAKILTRIAKEDKDQYESILHSLNNVGRNLVATYGREASLTLKDIRPGAAVRHFQESVRNAMKKVYSDPKLTQEEKKKRIIALGAKMYQRAIDISVQDAKDKGSAFALQMTAGVRGKPVQLMQLRLGTMLNQDSRGRDIPYLGLDNYGSGTDPLNFWVGSMGSRKGYVNQQFATAESGYMAKQMANAVHSTPIATHDCGTTTTGVPVKAASDDNLGAVLLRDWKGYKAGSVITEDMIAKAGDDDMFIIRSPLTCRAKHGVCAVCSGLNEYGKFPSVGEFVALNAARSFSEPLTQAAVGSKHAAAANLHGDDDDIVDDTVFGLQAVEQLMSVPSTFKGRAVLTPMDGTITSITKAPQGGSNVVINGMNTIYVPANRKLRKSVGDTLTAGDAITNGIPNPSEIVKYKGLGEGREYFVKRLRKTLDDAGAGTARRNLEQFTRAFINKVRITDPNGYRGYMPGDVVGYSDIQAEWTPREDSKTMNADKALGKYLDEPVLDFSIGTKITKPVIEKLKKYDFNTVAVNDHEPPFQSEMVRSESILSSDPEWMPRMSGERLRDSLFDSARRGLKTSVNSPSMYAKIVMSPYT